VPIEATNTPTKTPTDTPTLPVEPTNTPTKTPTLTPTQVICTPVGTYCNAFPFAANPLPRIFKGLVLIDYYGYLRKGPQFSKYSGHIEIRRPGTANPLLDTIPVDGSITNQTCGGDTTVTWDGTVFWHYSAPTVVDLQVVMVLSCDGINEVR